MTALKIVVSGAAGQIAYSLLPLSTLWCGNPQNTRRSHCGYV